mmetsp:Transcript_29710/g.41054  ORF Transcript_29710/g.41054 Transcript_29710/m.41054 type:complete len:321 (+) Transcript_29710:84-1046(+)
MSISNKILSSALRPTTNVDKYIHDVVLKRSSADEKDPLFRLRASTYYPYGNEENTPPTLDTLGGDLRSDGPSSSSSQGTKFKELLPRINVVEQDCLKHAQHLVSTSKFKRVGVLNMANEYNCGGAWSIHWGSQEEYLFRNTTLPLALWPHRRKDQDGFRSWDVGTELLGPASNDPVERWYPFTHCGGIFTPDVEVHSVCDQPLSKEKVFSISVLTIAAQDLRPKTRKGPFSETLLTQKLRTLFHMAIENHCDCLVLGALGCGAFLNHPSDVASSFASVLEELGTSFPLDLFPLSRVDFAIIKSRSNLSAFRNVFPNAGKL